MSLLVAGAILRTVAVSLFVAGTIFGDVAVSLFVAGAIFGDVAVSLFVAGAVYKMRLRSAKSKLGERAGASNEFGFGPWSNRPRTANDASIVFGQFLLDFGVQFCVAGAVFGEVGG